MAQVQVGADLHRLTFESPAMHSSPVQAQPPLRALDILATHLPCTTILPHIPPSTPSVQVQESDLSQVQPWELTQQEVLAELEAQAAVTLTKDPRPQGAPQWGGPTQQCSSPALFCFL